MKDVIENYFLVTTNDSFKEAKSLLDQRYGDQFKQLNLSKCSVEKVKRQIPLLIQRNPTGTDIHLLQTKEEISLHSRLPGQENPVLLVKENIISTTVTIF